MTSELDYRTAFAAYEKGIAQARQNRWQAALPYLASAFKFHSGNARYALFLGGALWHAGDRQAAIYLWSLGADNDPMVRIAQYHPQADNLTKEISKLADAQIRKAMTQSQKQAVESVGRPGRIRSALWPQNHDGAVTYSDDGPRPYMLLVPGFPETAVFDRKAATWTQELEAAVDSIRGEFLALTKTGNPGAPYVSTNSRMGEVWEPLRGQDKWTSIHLFKDGAPTEYTQSCPQTTGALKNLPLVYHKGNPMEVFFSVLKPQTHIPPHYGVSNTRLTVHLPLIIPSDCAIRVGDHKHSWIEGETFLFDDSFDHEAWNYSDQTRVVLIFEAWRPDMSEGEIEAVKASYAARASWLERRKIPNLDVLINGAT